MNCDQVFDVLTRGPFPTGAPEDIAVEHHLRACHECRQLAEALRPAVALMHEAVGADKAMALPQYQGSLPSQRPEKHPLAVIRLATSRPASRSEMPATQRAPGRRGERRAPQVMSASRIIAAALLLAALGLLIGQRVLSPRAWQQLAIVPASFLSSAPAAADPAEGMPGEKGLLTLASLKLPPACMPLTHRPLSPEHAAQLLSALSNGSLDALHCCTECHHAGVKDSRIAKVAAISQQNCQACHRG
jgi:hypothetical protein